jgi:O-antigen/teichoic acid export membrane protein
MSRRGSAADVAELLIAAGVSGVLSFAYVVYAGRHTAPAEYADFWAALGVIYVFTLLLNPIAPYAADFAARHDDAAALHAFRRTVLRRLTVFAGVTIVVALIAARPLATLLHFRSSATLLIAVGASIAYGFLSLDRGLLQGSHRLRAYNINLIVETVSRLVVAAIAFTIARTASAALAGQLLGMLIAQVLIVPRRAPVTPLIEPVEADAHDIAVPVFLLMLGLAIFQNVDTFAVKRWLPDSAATYAVAAVLARILTALAVPLYVLLVPAVARAGRLALSAAMKICGIYVAVASVLLTVFASFAPLICTTLFGPAYAGAAPLVLPLAAITAALNLTFLLTQASISMRRPAVLYVYLAAAAAECVALALHHDSVRDVIAILAVVNGALMTVMIAAAVVPRTTRA